MNGAARFIMEGLLAALSPQKHAWVSLPLARDLFEFTPPLCLFCVVVVKIVVAVFFCHMELQKNFVLIWLHTIGRTCLEAYVN